MDKGAFVCSLNPCHQESYLEPLDIPHMAPEWMHKWVSEYGKKSKQINVFEINTKIQFSQSVSLIVTLTDERIKLPGLL